MNVTQIIRIIGESDTTNTNTNADEDNTETKTQLNNWSTKEGHPSSQLSLKEPTEEQDVLYIINTKTPYQVCHLFPNMMVSESNYNFTAPRNSELVPITTISSPKRQLLLFCRSSLQARRLSLCFLLYWGSISLSSFFQGFGLSCPGLLGTLENEVPFVLRVGVEFCAVGTLCTFSYFCLSSGN